MKRLIVAYRKGSAETLTKSDLQILETLEGNPAAPAIFARVDDHIAVRRLIGLCLEAHHHFRTFQIKIDQALEMKRKADNCQRALADIRQFLQECSLPPDRLDAYEAPDEERMRSEGMALGSIAERIRTQRRIATETVRRLSYEAIYRSLFIQTRGVLKKELTAHLRTARRMRRPKSHNAKSGQGHILDMVSIRDRPAEVEDRAVPGHWEGDLLTGANDTHIATLVERNTRFTMLVRIPRKDTTTVVAKLAKHIRKLPKELRRSLTWDQGKEMHAHKRFTVATDVQVYFCDPRSPWQRGSNENTNGLLRQYFPKGNDLSVHSQPI